MSMSARVNGLRLGLQYRKQPFTIDGHSAVKLVASDIRPGPEAVFIPDITVLVEYSPTSVLLIEVRAFTEDKEYVLGIANRMIASLRFDGSEAVKATWKTYRNDEYGYEMRYPDNKKLTFEGKTVFIVPAIEDGQEHPVIFIKPVMSDGKSLRELAIDSFSSVTSIESECETVSIENRQSLLCNPSITFAGETYLLLPLNDETVLLMQVGYGGMESLREFLATYRFRLIDLTANTSDWKTFHNNAGWTIMHPEDWRVGSCHYCDPTEAEGFVSFIPEDYDNGGWVLIQHLADKPQEMGVAEWIDRVVRTNNLHTVSNYESISIDGYPARRVHYNDLGGSESVYVVHSNETYEVSFSQIDALGNIASTRITDAKNYQIYKNMLASLEFEDDSTGAGVTWKTYRNTELGFYLNYPPEWVVREGTRAVAFRNVSEPRSEISDEVLQSESRFLVSIHQSTNPDLLPISEWFDRHFANGFANEPDSRTIIKVDNTDAVRLVVTEIGSRVHLYVPRGPDVIEIIYGLYAPHFVDEYETILKSFRVL